MRPTFHIQLARVEEAAALSDLCFRSKAVWGYNAGFMALMLAALKVAPEDIVAGNVWIATRADGQIAGVVALAPGEAPGTLDLSKLFIERGICAAASAVRYSSTRSPRRVGAAPSG